jgi:hypothetical protein
VKQEPQGTKEGEIKFRWNTNANRLYSKNDS